MDGRGEGREREREKGYWFLPPTSLILGLRGVNGRGRLGEKGEEGWGEGWGGLADGERGEGMRRRKYKKKGGVG